MIITIADVRRAAASAPAMIASAVLTVAIALTAVISLITIDRSTPSSGDIGSGLRTGANIFGASSPPSESHRRSAAPRTSGPAAAPGRSRSSTPPATRAPTRRSGGIAAACDDIAAIRAANKDVNSSSVTKVRALFATIERAATDLVRDAPKDIAAPAAAFLRAVTTLKGFVDKVSSIDQLSQQTQQDPKLAGAFTDLATSDQRISVWAASKC